MFPGLADIRPHMGSRGNNDILGRKCAFSLYIKHQRN
jgi:hypothetical protein